MPNRIIRESITTSHSWDALSFPAEAFCTRLITVVDDYGRQDARPSVLRAKCFPLKLARVSDALVAKWLAELADAGLVVVYAGEHGGQYLQFVNWTKYQNVRARESKFPAPCDQVIADAINRDQMIADVPVTRYSDLVTRISETRDARPAARSAQTLDEDRAYEDAAKKGYGRAETTDMLEAFRDHWQSKGWRDKDGPLKDINARFRTWLRNQAKYGYPPSVSPPSPDVDVAAEREKQAREERLAREAKEEQDFQERLAITRQINAERERLRAAS